jgi:lipoate---protein ligase
MRLLHTAAKDVYQNLALEDILLHGSNEDLLLLWQSKRAVVCGKHQNVCSEVNYGYCKINEIQVARRLSGGGTVFHDTGNLNFTFICSLKDGMEKAINFRRFLDPVIEVLQSLGIKADYSTRNDLLWQGKKISGNAQHLFQKEKKVLHHGTLLFDTDLKSLGKALHSDGNYESKAVKSVRSEVINLQEAAPEMNFDSFLHGISAGFEKMYGNAFSNPTDAEIDQAKNLAIEKYTTEKWVIGYSPKYKVNREFIYDNKSVLLSAAIENGVVNQISFQTQTNETILQNVSQSLTGQELDSKLADRFVDMIGDETLRYILF